MTVETKDLKGIKNLNLVYLLNALGEDTGIAPIPENVMSWYNETVLDNEWLSYLVKKRTPTAFCIY
ncbi:MAG TPA: hypothetical protein VJ546_03150 [Bacillales bacterium]|nr:hypothetical protein [Bacillales bacterium]